MCVSPWIPWTAVLFHMRFLVSPLFGVQVYVISISTCSRPAPEEIVFRGGGFGMQLSWEAVPSVEPSGWDWCPKKKRRQHQSSASLSWVGRRPGRALFPGAKSADTAISHIPAPGLREINVCCLSHPVYGIFLVAAEAKTKFAGLFSFNVFTVEFFVSHPLQSLMGRFPCSLCFCTQDNYFNDNTSAKFVLPVLNISWVYSARNYHLVFSPQKNHMVVFLLCCWKTPTRSWSWEVEEPVSKSRLI